MKPFHERRRQQFMYEAFYVNNRIDQLDAIQRQRNYLDFCLLESTRDLSNIALYQEYTYHEKFWLWMLDYSGGVELEALAPRLDEIVDEFVEWYRVNIPYREYLKNKYTDRHVEVEVSPVDFDNQIDYQDALQFLSVAILLRDSRSIRRIIGMLDSNRSGDELFDTLVSYYMDDDDDTAEADDLIHEQPYRLLLNCWYEEANPDKQIQLVKDYCENWYKYQDGSRWYDGHKHIADNDTGPYYGYWAFEAGATCYLLDIDDSTIEHMVYPKDLVAYARQLEREDRRTSTEEDASRPPPRMRALHGEPVPQTGIWTTPAITGAAGRRRFQVGDCFPDIAYTDWGEVIWYWDDNQSE